MRVVSLNLWGRRGDWPARQAVLVAGLRDLRPDLVAFRGPLFEGCAHHYDDQRDIADRVPESTLRMTPADVAQLINGSRIADRLTGAVAELLDQDQTVSIAQLATELAA